MTNLVTPPKPKKIIRLKHEPRDDCEACEYYHGNYKYFYAKAAVYRRLKAKHIKDGHPELK